MTGESNYTPPLDPNTRPKRRDVLHNTVSSNRFGEKFEKPDQAALNEIMDNESRVRYFAIPEPAQGLGELAIEGSSDENIENRSSSMNIEFVVGDELGKRIAEEFPGRQLVTRGTMTSINGAVSLETGGTILDVQDVVALGEERSRGWFRGTPFPGIGSKPTSIDYMSVREALEAKAFSQTVASDGFEESEKSIFPTVLVYDATQLERQQSSGHGYSIPVDSSPVLAAYVIDRPI